MAELDDVRLNKLATNRLLALLNSVRAKESNVFHHAGPRCCEECNEYIGDDWEGVKAQAAPYTHYINRIKAVLATREHVK
jgi:hypothetical protein